MSEYRKAYDRGAISYDMYQRLENGPPAYYDDSYGDMVRQQRFTNTILLWNTPMHEMNRK
jgi:hypothetical protein